MRQLGSLVLLSALALAGCNRSETDSNVGEAGAEKSGKDKLLNAGAEMLQHKAPLNAFSTYLDGFHFYNGNMKAQMEAHHYVTQLSADLYQAIIFDGNERDAKIMGVEYIITEKLFKGLPEEEKKLWHGHVHEVKSGTLIAPGIPKKAEHELMEKLVSTYGKTIHTWHTDQERSLPVGAPMIMMAFTKDGQLQEHLVKERDARLKVNTAEAREHRLDIPVPKPIPGANAWEKGEYRQFVITSKIDSAVHKHQMQ
ncbi:DUF1264 domain-containing protein [Pedobacter yulinensis]|uniref:DUF1264 domain-containing protein n=2 Tax=Pedobacter yulinensis TaxID=2126353 RepID=A0A2T3HMV7_9SPHI|nr:DUF1264 domain-containing protein [Pedobacter yulinensis]